MRGDHNAAFKLFGVPVDSIHPLLQRIVEVLVVQSPISDSQYIQFPHHLIGHRTVPNAFEKGTALVKSTFRMAKHFGRSSGVLTSPVDRSVTCINENDGVGKHDYGF
jgi:hypothetical protein